MTGVGSRRSGRPPAIPPHTGSLALALSASSVIPGGRPPLVGHEIIEVEFNRTQFWRGSVGLRQSEEVEEEGEGRYEADFALG